MTNKDFFFKSAILNTENKNIIKDNSMPIGFIIAINPNNIPKRMIFKEFSKRNIKTIEKLINPKNIDSGKIVLLNEV